MDGVVIAIVSVIAVSVLMHTFLYGHARQRHHGRGRY